MVQQRWCSRWIRLVYDKVRSRPIKKRRRRPESLSPIENLTGSTEGHLACQHRKQCGIDFGFLLIYRAFKGMGGKQFPTRFATLTKRLLLRILRLVVAVFHLPARAWTLMLRASIVQTMLHVF